MAFPSVTYSFTNGTTADATQVNQNFTDLINSLSDGTKSLNISAITTGGVLTANANTILGSSSSNTVTFTAVVTSAGVPISGSGSFTTTIAAGASTSTYTLTTPLTTPTNTTFVTMTSTGQLGTNGRASTVGQQISSSCGSFTTTSASFTSVTNLTVTITTSGRPVFIGLINDGTGTDAQILTGASNFRSQFVRGATSLGVDLLATNTGFPLSSLWIVDTPASGTYTYILQVKSNGAATQAISNAKLLAYEL